MIWKKRLWRIHIYVLVLFSLDHDYNSGGWFDPAPSFVGYMHGHDDRSIISTDRAFEDLFQRKFAYTWNGGEGVIDKMFHNCFHTIHVLHHTFHKTRKTFVNVVIFPGISLLYPNLVAGRGILWDWKVSVFSVKMGVLIWQVSGKGAMFILQNYHVPPPPPSIPVMVGRVGPCRFGLQ